MSGLNIILEEYQDVDNTGTEKRRETKKLINLATKNISVDNKNEKRYH